MGYTLRTKTIRNNRNINCSFSASVWKHYFQSPNYPDPETGETEWADTHYEEKILYFIYPSVSGDSYSASVGEDLEHNFFLYIGAARKQITNGFTLNVAKTKNIKIKYDISVSAGWNPYNFRTLLKTNYITSANANVKHDNSYVITESGTNMGTYTTENQTDRLLCNHFLLNSGSSVFWEESGYKSGVVYNEYWEKISGDATATLTCDDWDIPAFTETVTGEYGTNTVSSQTSHSITVSLNDPTLSIRAEGDFADNEAGFRYYINTARLPNDIIRDYGRFSANGTEWTGKTSPTFWFGNKTSSIHTKCTGQYSNISFTGKQPDSHSETYNESNAYWNKSTDREHTAYEIGNVEFLNPQIVNDCKQKESEPPEWREPLDVPNTIMKAELPFLGNVNNKVEVKFVPHKIAEKTDWQLTNCVKRTVNNTEIICGVAYDSEGNEYITGVPENAKISVPQISRPKYTDESGEVPWNYRQTHWTKARYIQFNTQNSEPLTPVFDEDGAFLRYDGTFDFMLIENPLKLKCVSYGEVDGAEWTLKRTGCLKWNNSSPHYDVAVYDNFKIGEGTDGTESYFDFSNCEDLQIYQEHPAPQLSDVYRAELPSSSQVFGANIVGSIEMPLTEGKVYRLGELIPFVGKEIIENGQSGYKEWHGWEMMASEEFVEPKYLGEHGIHYEEQYWSETIDMYACNYATFLLNGRRAFQIPMCLISKMPTHKVWIYDVYKLSDLKMTEGSEWNRPIYPRDDRGEIFFDIKTYTADADGDYPIEALLRRDALVPWIYGLIQDEQDGKLYLTVYPNADCIRGDLFTLLTEVEEGVIDINVTGHFGGKAQGIVSKLADINITDTSGFEDETIEWQIGKDHYLSDYHGSATSYQLYDSIGINLTEVSDGQKINLTHYKGYGKILKNRQEKILKNSREKINVGGEYGNN